MPTSLTDQDISATYKGLIHAQGVSLPILSQARLYDGDGTPTALSVGANSNGVTVYGPLTATSTISTPDLFVSTNVAAPNAAKAWVCFRSTGINGAQTITASHNVATVSRNNTGADQVYSIAFTADALKDSNYCYQISYTYSRNELANKMMCAFADSLTPPSKNSINLCFRIFNGSVTSPFDPTTASLTIYNT